MLIGQYEMDFLRETIAQFINSPNLFSLDENYLTGSSLHPYLSLHIYKTQVFLKNLDWQFIQNEQNSLKIGK